MTAPMDCAFQKDGCWFRLRAAAIILEDGNVLMAHNDREPYYYSVGGAVRHDEAIEDAVVREVREETGESYEIDRLAFLHENFFDATGEAKGLRCHEVTFYFLMKPRGIREFFAPSTTDDGVTEEVCWLPLDRFSSYTAYPAFFGEKLQNLKPYPEHIITRENTWQQEKELR